MGCDVLDTLTSVANLYALRRLMMAMVSMSRVLPGSHVVVFAIGPPHDNLEWLILEAQYVATVATFAAH